MLALLYIHFKHNKIMKQKIQFLDAEGQRVIVEIEHREPKGTIHKHYETLEDVPSAGELSICAQVACSSGQCLDHIIATPAQHKLIEFWKKYHLNTMRAGTKKQEDALKAVQEELNKKPGYSYDKEKEYLISIGLYIDRDYRYGSGWLYKPYPKEELDQIIEEIMTQENQRKERARSAHFLLMDDPENETRIIQQLQDALDYTLDTAQCIYALGKHCKIETSELQYITADGGHRFTCQGVEYYVGSDDELSSIAKEYLEDEDYIWRDAVANGNTTLGLSDWIDEVINMDGFASILNSYDGKYNDIHLPLSDRWICICRN